MPIPKPRQDEERSDYVSRCMDAISGEYDDTDQALAVCFSTWRESRKRSMSPHEELLKAIKSRQEKLTEFNGGILTADRYVKTLQECVGSDLCYRYAAKGNVSLDDVIKKASSTLTYNNPDMVVLDSVADWKKSLKEADLSKFGEDIEIPKNTLMVIKHVLTTPRKDRDGDVMRTEGADPDPNMLLLWQHVHTLPIGKMLAVAEHTSKKLVLYSAVIDMNELCHDAAVMIDNKMGRFSHGFRALEFNEIKEEAGETTSPGGFDIKRFEIMEESLVSVPSNVDAETEEILMSLVDSGKMTSSLMKNYSKSIKEHRPKQFNVPVNLDLNVRINGKDVSNANLSGDGSGSTKGTGKETKCSCGGSPKETNEGAGKKREADDSKMIGGLLEGSWEYIESKLYEKAGKFLSNNGVALGDEDWVSVIGTYSDHAILCVYRDNKEPEYYKASWRLSNGEPEFMDSPKRVDVQIETEIIERIFSFLGNKAGRVISKANYKKLVDAKEDMMEIHKEHVSSRSGKAICKDCIHKLQDVIDAAGMDEQESKRNFSVEEAMAKVISESSSEQRKRLRLSLEAIDGVDKRESLTRQFRSLLGRSS